MNKRNLQIRINRHLKHHSENNDILQTMNEYVLCSFLQASEKNLIYEGLIMTHNIDVSTEIMKQELKYGGVFSIPEQNKIRINFKLKNHNIEFITKSIKLMDNLGWFPALYHYKEGNENITTKYNHNIKQFITGLSDINIDNFNLIFEAKYDLEITELPEYVYHISPTQYRDFISMKGLKPKDKSKTSYHPERLYFFPNINDTKNLLIKLIPYDKNREEKQLKSFDVYRIKTSYFKFKEIRTFEDNNFSNVNALYILEPVWKNALELVNSYKIP